ncbi:hypothetical protein P7K49_019847 [Saguinus oedipus]|uniref:Uncharacterized protein n=1 Tax=Saguinus oedipus TaxID=9490 RepID=A0ABQ9UZK5_SAGOE|nr:hypothetical protein P7K49_019847 [Saguinus oedipus]
MAERGLEPSPAVVAALPPEVRAQLAELELELSEGRTRAGERAPGALRIAETRETGPRRAPWWPCGKGNEGAENLAWHSTTVFPRFLPR